MDHHRFVITVAVGLLLSTSVVIADNDSKSFDEWVSDGVSLLTARGSQSATLGVPD
jgi:hypothetical protein